MIKNSLVFFALLCLISCNNEPNANSDKVGSYIEYQEPKHYVCPQVLGIEVDGNLDEWSDIAWTDYFNDIEGLQKPKPKYKTRAKLAWNEEYLYIAAELEEPHIWANITERDEVIFYDNDFEVFIDPDGDTHHYYELEINAFETAWDLLLTMPYRDFGYVIDSWDINGMKIGVSVNGSINDPSDTDISWTVEMALPMSVLQECNAAGAKPQPGDYWRINFSRVEWQTEIDDGKYVKKTNPETQKSYPEDNWVWSPQFHINMHMPEYWGFLVFADSSQDSQKQRWSAPKDENTKWILRNVYYLQKKYFSENKTYASSMKELGWENLKGGDLLPIPELQQTLKGYQAFLPGSMKGSVWVINEKGRVYKTNE